MAHRHGELTLGFPPCSLARLHRTRLYLKPRRLPGVQNLESAAIYTGVANLCNIASAALHPSPLLDATLYPQCPSTTSHTPVVATHQEAEPVRQDQSHSEAGLPCVHKPRTRLRLLARRTARLWFQPSPAAAQSDISSPRDEPLQLQLQLLTSNHGRRNRNFAVEAVDIRQARSCRTPSTTLQHRQCRLEP
jgi:hypothetical protein